MWVPTIACLPVGSTKTPFKLDRRVVKAGKATGKSTDSIWLGLSRSMLMTCGCLPPFALPEAAAGRGSP